MTLLRRGGSENVHAERSSTGRPITNDRELHDESTAPLASEKFHTLANVRSFLAAECGVQRCDGEFVHNAVGLYRPGRDKRFSGRAVVFRQ
jgi:hypothetical protein